MKMSTLLILVGCIIMYCKMVSSKNALSTNDVDTDAVPRIDAESIQPYNGTLEFMSANATRIRNSTATLRPTISPSKNEIKSFTTNNPTVPSNIVETKAPIYGPSMYPTRVSNAPTITLDPSIAPTTSPSNTPSKYPTETPTNSPSNDPTSSPTDNPTISPSEVITQIPQNISTTNSSPYLTTMETNIPSRDPTTTPTNTPTSNPSIETTISILTAEEEVESTPKGKTKKGMLIVIISIASIVVLGILFYLFKGFALVKEEVNADNNVVFSKSSIHNVSPSEYDGVYSPQSEVITPRGNELNINNNAFIVETANNGETPKGLLNNDIINNDNNEGNTTNDITNNADMVYITPKI